MENVFSVDDFLLREPTKLPFLATLEKSKNDDSKIIIKQYFENGNSCSCDRSFELDKKLIKEVKITEIKKNCCGGIHNVVEVVFVDNFSLDLNSFMSILNKFTSELEKKTIRTDSELNQNLQSQAKEGQCWPGMIQCDPKNPYHCYNPNNSCCCYNPVSKTYRIVGKSGNCGYTCAHFG